MRRLAALIVFAVCMVSAVCWVEVSPAWGNPPPPAHPAVVRVVAPENGSTSSYGSGVLVAVESTTGLVLTNWHVVRDATGPLVVYFPDGFRSRAYLLKTDRDWDLAALAVRRPNVRPVAIAMEAPRPGDPLTIAGYGPGMYRTITGQCTTYFSPGGNLPREIVELSVPAREGDSGGPIFNSRGELAGVLFGADPSNTVGSYCGRVRIFLNSTTGEFRRFSAWAASVTHTPQTAMAAAAPAATAAPAAIAAMPPAAQPPVANTMTQPATAKTQPEMKNVDFAAKADSPTAKPAAESTSFAKAAVEKTTSAKNPDQDASTRKASGNKAASNRDSLDKAEKNAAETKSEEKIAVKAEKKIAQEDDHDIANAKPAAVAPKIAANAAPKTTPAKSKTAAVQKTSKSASQGGATPPPTSRTCALQRSQGGAAPVSESTMEQIKNVLAVIGIGLVFYHTIRFMGVVIG